MTDHRIGVIGLGYVGLPLTVAFGEKYRVVGFDINDLRISQLQQGFDNTGEIQLRILKRLTKAFSQNAAYGISFTRDPGYLANCNVLIITVPTPVDSSNSPDLTALKKASITAGKVLSFGTVIVFESTVYPGCTEEVAVPLLEEYSGLKFNRDFFCGYSPERINPGDKRRKFKTIRKITSGSTAETANLVDRLYKSVISAGTFPVSSIRVAEAAKIIENAQRDVNIAFMNELSKIFNKLNLNTAEILSAAGTKWNFLPFRPGLVGGHCISIDPFYLTHKAQKEGYEPSLLLAARAINDGMGDYIGERMIGAMLKKNIQVIGARILVMGITFKADFGDLRNSKVVDIIRYLAKEQADVSIFDPYANPAAVNDTYQLSCSSVLPAEKFDGVIVAVDHAIFAEIDYSRLLLNPGVLFDVKSIINTKTSLQLVDERL